MADSITRTEIKDMVIKQIDKSVQSMVDKKVKEIIGAKATQNEISEIISKTLIKFYKLLWMRSAMWARDLK